MKTTFSILVLMMFSSAAAGQSVTNEARALTATEDFLSEALISPQAAAAVRSPQLAAFEPVEAFVTRWQQNGGPGVELESFTAFGVTLYDRDASGNQVNYAAVDFLALTSQDRVICGYLVLDLDENPVAVLREDISTIPPEIVTTATQEQLLAFTFQLGCGPRS